MTEPRLDGIEALARSGTEVERRVRSITDRQWTLPTPCDAWDVRALVGHIVAGNVMGALLLRGGTIEEAWAVFETDLLGDDTIDTCAAAIADQLVAFREMGSLDTIVHHPIGDVPATRLLEFRTIDLTVHAWDLARAIGAEEDLDSELVEEVWIQAAPLLDSFTASGLFGAGASGDVPDDAPAQQRLLDVLGRQS